MNKRKLTILALLISAKLSLASCLIYLPGDTHEEVVLTTDRSIYITGEKVRFFASLLNGDNPNTKVQSQILYAEIITPDGNKITGNKFLIRNSSSDGCVDIPDNMLTGTYYLRAYTKLMRNYGPEFYGYRQIRIVNPARSDLLAIESNRELSAVQLIQHPNGDLNDMLRVSVDKVVHAPRDTIMLDIKLENVEVAGFKSLCLSVIPENTKSASSLINPVNKQINFEMKYFPETRGLSVSGKLAEAFSKIPVKDKKVNLSIIGEGRDFMAVRTDSAGMFYFALPDYSGSRDLFLCAEKTDSVKLKIWVDNDFCALPIHLPSPEFSLSELERTNVQNMALNAQINAYFYNDSLNKSQNATDYKSVFYGKPTNIIYIDKYIQLPTLEEYFNELPSEVKVRKRKGEPRFDVLGTRGVSFYEPLILVDWVAVDEPSKVLAVSPQNISRIEVVKDEYVKGGQTYGGIVSIISKKGDFAGIDLPSTGIFINYHFLSENYCYEEGYDSLPTHPDSRNTILWKPGIIIQDGKSEKIVFTAPDTPGRYNVVVEGVTKSGEVVSVTGKFEVTN